MNNRERWTLTAAVLGSAIVFVDSTVVNVALPRIGRELPTTLFGVLEGQSYVYNGYLLTLSALLILAAALSDFYGRRRMFLVGLVGFGATSVLCGASPNMEFLVASRVLQGAAGALLVPGSLAILTATFTGEAQGRAFGVWAAASAATTILGPFVGGILVDTLSWRAAFLINVPLVAIAVWATIQHVAETRNESASGYFDWGGAGVVAVAVGGLSFGAIYGQQRDWKDPLAYVALAAGVGAAERLPRRLSAGPDHLRRRPRDDGRAAHDRAHDQRARPQLRGRVGDQQRDLACRAAARGRGDLRGDHRDLLRGDGRAASRHGYLGRDFPARLRAAERAAHPGSEGRGRSRAV